MNVLDRITDLRLGRGWSEYQLAEYSGLTQSTISAWYRKNMIPSIPSLQRICDAFGISLSQFFLEENSQAVFLTPKQIELINTTNKLSNTQFDLLVQFLNNITQTPHTTNRI